MLFAHRPGVVEQSARGLDLDIGAAELAVMAALDLAAELGGHGHLAVADAEHGHAGIEDGLRGARRAFLVNRLRAAGEDHRLRLHLPEGRFGLLERDDFRIDPLLADAAGDQLRDLAAEIDNQNLVMRRGHGGHRLAGVLGCCHGKQIRDGGRPRNPPCTVMAGLDPAIHAFWAHNWGRHSGAPKGEAGIGIRVGCGPPRNDGYLVQLFFNTDTKNPSVPVRRGVISQPSGVWSAALAKSSALSQSAVAVCSVG